jgi:replicative DNA helicase
VNHLHAIGKRDDILSRVPPHDDQAELAVLCGILVRPEVLSDVLAVCDGRDFYHEKNQLVFSAMVRLWNEGTPIDAITLIDALRCAGDFERGADHRYVQHIAEANLDVPARAETHARVVHELALKRDLALSAAKIASDAIDNEGDSALLLSEAQRALDNLRVRQTRERPSTAQVLRETVAHLDDVASEAVATGFPNVDRALAGGFRAGELIVLAAPTSRGKSAFALNVAARIARGGGGALVFSLEMSERELARRLLHSEAQVEHPLGAINLSGSARERIQHTADEFAHLKLEIQYRPALTPMVLRAVAQRYAREWGGNLKIIVADYVGLMRPDVPQERREREVASITRELKLIAGELNCTVLAVAQLNREIARREDGVPRLSDLRDSGALEQDADIVAFLAELRDQPGVWLIIEKARRAPLTRVRLDFRASMTRFEDLDGAR